MYARLLGGDFSKVYSANITGSRRIKYLNEFIAEHDLVMQDTGKTFIHSNGADSSTIDFIFYQKLLEGRVSAFERLHELPVCESNSDHYPLKHHLQVNISNIQSKSQNLLKSQKVWWDKLDRDLYVASVTKGLERLDIVSSSMGNVDNTVMKFNEQLVFAKP